MCLSLSSNNILSVLRGKEAKEVLWVRLVHVVMPGSQANWDPKVPEEREAPQLVLPSSVCPCTSSREFKLSCSHTWFHTHSVQLVDVWKRAKQRVSWGNRKNAHKGKWSGSLFCDGCRGMLRSDWQQTASTAATRVQTRDYSQFYFRWRVEVTCRTDSREFSNTTRSFSSNHGLCFLFSNS